MKKESITFHEFCSRGGKSHKGTPFAKYRSHRANLAKAAKRKAAQKAQTE
jgi:hypothetical protein